MTLRSDARRHSARPCGIPAPLRFWLAVLLTGDGHRHGGRGADTAPRSGAARDVGRLWHETAGGGNSTRVPGGASACCFAPGWPPARANPAEALSSGNGIDTTEAIWFYAGRMPAVRTLWQRRAFHIHRGHGHIARPRRRAEAGGRGTRQLLFRPRPTVGRTAPAAGCLRGGGRHGCGVRRSAGRRAVFAGGDARGAGAALRASRAGHLAGRRGGFVARAAGCAHVHDPRLCQFRVVRGVGAAGRADRGRGVGRLCAYDSLGGPRTSRRTGGD